MITSVPKPFTVSFHFFYYTNNKEASQFAISPDLSVSRGNLGNEIVTNFLNSWIKSAFSEDGSNNKRAMMALDCSPESISKWN